MSYVFSKALKETPEEREKRKAATQPKWSVPSSPPPQAGAPPPVAAKPTPTPVNSGINQAEEEEPSIVRSGSVSDAREKFRGSARSYSVDSSDYGIGPKMGGAFARLQANLQKEPSSGGLYKDAYEAYKIKRSLKEHGVLPTNLRSNEQLRKYSLDKGGPPVVLPKPRTASADAKRGAFAKNRSMTTPTSPTGDFFQKETAQPTSVFDEGPEDAAAQFKIEEEAKNDAIASNSEEPLKEVSADGKASEPEPASTNVDRSTEAVQSPTNHEVLKPVHESQPEPLTIDSTDGATSKIEPVEKLKSILDKTEQQENVPVDTPPSTPSSPLPTSPFGDPTEIKKLEQSPDVIAMKQQIVQEKSKLQEGKRHLSDAIDELENVDFDLALKKEPIAPSEHKIIEEAPKSLCSVDECPSQPANTAEVPSSTKEEISTPFTAEEFPPPPTVEESTPLSTEKSTPPSTNENTPSPTEEIIMPPPPAEIATPPLSSDNNCDAIDTNATNNSELQMKSDALSTTSDKEAPVQHEPESDISAGQNIGPVQQKELEPKSEIESTAAADNSSVSEIEVNSLNAETGSAVALTEISSVNAIADSSSITEAAPTYDAGPAAETPAVEAVSNGSSTTVSVTAEDTKEAPVTYSGPDAEVVAPVSAPNVSPVLEVVPPTECSSNETSESVPATDLASVEPAIESAPSEPTTEPDPVEPTTESAPAEPTTEPAPAPVEPTTESAPAEPNTEPAPAPAEPTIEPAPAPVEPITESAPTESNIESAPAPAEPTTEPVPVETTTESVPAEPTTEPVPVEPNTEPAPVEPTTESVPVEPTIAPALGEPSTESAPAEAAIESSPVEPAETQQTILVDKITQSAVESQASETIPTVESPELPETVPAPTTVVESAPVTAAATESETPPVSEKIEIESCTDISSLKNTSIESVSKCQEVSEQELPVTVTEPSQNANDDSLENKTSVVEQPSLHEQMQPESPLQSDSNISADSEKTPDTVEFEPKITHEAVEIPPVKQEQNAENKIDSNVTFETPNTDLAETKPDQVSNEKPVEMDANANIKLPSETSV